VRALQGIVLQRVATIRVHRILMPLNTPSLCWVVGLVFFFAYENFGCTHGVCKICLFGKQPSVSGLRGLCKD
jgi:hypothetical protein